MPSGNNIKASPNFNLFSPHFRAEISALLLSTGYAPYDLKKMLRKVLLNNSFFAKKFGLLFIEAATIAGSILAI